MLRCSVWVQSCYGGRQEAYFALTCHHLSSRRGTHPLLRELSLLCKKLKKLIIILCFNWVFCKILIKKNAPISRKIIRTNLKPSPDFKKGLDVKKEDIFVFGLGWLAANTPQLVQLLNALLPLIVIGVLGYAIHLIGRDRGDKK